MPETATEFAITPTTLRAPWRDVSKEIQSHLKIGRAIKNQRIRDQWELDHARAEKAEWIRRTSEILTTLFSTPTIAEQCLEYAAPVLPEYAEFDLFVDQFEDEMRHRLARLQDVLKQLDTMSEATPSASGEMQADESAAPEAKSEPEERKTVMIDEAIAATTATILEEPVPQAPRTVVNVPRQQVADNRTPGAGLLILATANEETRIAASTFLNDLGFKLEVVDRVAQPTATAAESLAQSDSSFAVVVADAAAMKDAASDLQFELGYCAGRLGAARVFIAAPASDAITVKRGIQNIAIDAAGGWQLQMARHLKRAGIPVDLNKLC